MFKIAYRDLLNILSHKKYELFKAEKRINEIIR